MCSVVAWIGQLWSPIGLLLSVGKSSLSGWAYLCIHGIIHPDTLTQSANNVELMLIQHPDIESTLIQRCFNVVCLLGSGWTKPVMGYVAYDISD